MPFASTFKHNVLCALPKRELAESFEILVAFGDRQKMVAGELADLARKMNAAVGKQYLGLADAARIKDDLAT